MKRPLRIRLLLLALGGVSALAFVVIGLPVLTARGLEKALGGLFKRPVSVGSVSVIGLVPLQIEIRKVRVGGATPESPPFQDRSACR